MADYKQQLMGLDDASLDSMAKNGYVNAQTVAQIKAARGGVNYNDVSMGLGVAPSPEVMPPTGSYSQDQIGKQMAIAATPDMNMADSNLAMAQASPEAYNAMQGGMTAGGGKPAPLPAPLATGLPQQVEAEVLAKAQTEAAHSGAAAGVAAHRQQQQDRTLAEAAAKDAQLEEEVSKDMDAEGGWGQRIGQAVAIMIGAQSQMYTGAKDNPAVEAIERQVKKHAEDRKYNSEKEAKLAELVLKRANQEMEEKKFTLDTMAKMSNMQKDQAEIQKINAELQTAKAGAALAQKQEFTPEEWAQIPLDKDGREMRNMGVRMPNGNYRLATREGGAQKLADLEAETGGALHSGNILLKKIEYFGNNPGKKLVDRAEIAETKAVAQGLVGAMRLPYLGPGTVTDTERDILNSVVRDPTNLASLSSANRASVMAVMAKIKHFRNESYRANGVDLPPSQNDLILKQAKKKYPAATDAALISALVRQGKWDINEQ